DVLVGSGDSPNVGGLAATTGNDVFLYTAMADAGDTVYGFDTRRGEADTIDLRPLFDALGYAGTTARAGGWLAVTTGTTPNRFSLWMEPNEALRRPNWRLLFAAVLIRKSVTGRHMPCTETMLSMESGGELAGDAYRPVTFR